METFTFRLGLNAFSNHLYVGSHFTNRLHSKTKSEISHRYDALLSNFLKRLVFFKANQGKKSHKINWQIFVSDLFTKTFI